jgi:hypothetical protein
MNIDIKAAASAATQQSPGNNDGIESDGALR